MIVWAVGRDVRTEATVLGDGRVARLSYDYVEFFFLFSVAANFRWELVGRDAADDVATTRAEIESTYGVMLSEPGLWTRYSFVLAAAAVLLVVLLVA